MRFISSYNRRKECKYFSGFQKKKIIILFRKQSAASDITIFRIIQLTVGSRKWEPGRERGRYFLVSVILIEKRKNKIIFSRQGLNCMKTIEDNAMINDIIDKTKKEDSFNGRYFSCWTDVGLT